MEPCIDRIAEASGDAMALDIGANMGQHAVYLGSKFRRVVAFEPQPLKALQVQRNARANALDNVRVCRCGLAFSRGYAHIFNKDGRNSGRAELIDATNGDKALHDGQGSEKEAPLQRVPLDTLTDFWHRNGQPRIALIKLDAEGFEPHIIRGGIEVLRSVRPVVIFEDWGLQWGAGHCANIARMAAYAGGPNGCFMATTTSLPSIRMTRVSSSSVGSCPSNGTAIPNLYRATTGGSLRTTGGTSPGSRIT